VYRNNGPNSPTGPSCWKFTDVEVLDSVVTAPAKHIRLADVTGEGSADVIVLDELGRFVVRP
jgi:hypothetical protein